MYSSNRYDSFNPRQSRSGYGNARTSSGNTRSTKHTSSRSGTTAYSDPNSSYIYTIIGLSLIVVLAYMTHSLYVTYNYDINGTKLGCIDTIKNILGMYSPQLKLPKLPKLPKISIIPKKEKEVFNIDQNIFTYKDAIAVCKAYDSELATYSQVEAAYKNNGNWCNYGWTKSADNKKAPALFITQKSYYDKLQKGPLENRATCGKPGINGGHFDDLDIKFGANCYGVKPDADPSKIKYQISNKINDGSSGSINSEVSEPINPTYEDIAKYKALIRNKSIELRPFNKNKWSRYSSRNSTYKLASDEIADEISDMSSTKKDSNINTGNTDTNNDNDVL
jgi:hypothetical protein